MAITLESLVGDGVGATITLTWSATCSPSNGYVQRKAGDAAWDTTYYTLNPWDVSYVDTGLSSNVRYQYKIVDDHAHESNTLTCMLQTDSITDSFGVASNDYVDGVVIRNPVDYAQTFTDTFTFTDWGGEIIPAADTFVDIVVLGDWISGAQTLSSDFVYYYADATGKVYTYDSSYKSDADEAITCLYRTKKLDFSDQYPQYATWNKTIYRIILTYIDKDEVTFNVTVKADGESPGTARARTLGSALTTTGYPPRTGKTKRATFDFIKSGQFFNIEIAQSSKNTTFQILGMDVEWGLRSKWFEI